jgi:hypothetical protein
VNVVEVGLAVDSAQASKGRFGPRPHGLYDDWVTFRDWADSAQVAAGESFDPEKGRCAITGATARRCPRRGQPVDVEGSGAAVDSLGPHRVGRLGFDAAVAYDVHRVDVSDGAIRRAHLTAWNELRIGLEGGGATALAALISGAYLPSLGEAVGVICSGGNVDLAHRTS